MRFLPRIRFSIRTLFLIITAIGLVLLPVTLRVHRVRQQYAAIAAVKKLDGFFGKNENPAELTQVFFINNLNDQQIASIVPHLQKFPKLKQIEIHSWRMTDKSVKNICELTTLEDLFLQDVSVTDASAKRLGQLSKLKRLGLQGDRLSDIGLSELANLQNLEALATSSPQVTDEGICQLSALPKLRQLNIGGTKITDTGLKKLVSMRTGILIVFDGISPNHRVYTREPAPKVVTH